MISSRIILMLIISILFVDAKGWCQVEVMDTVHWSAMRKLNWSDFLARPDTKSRGGAGTSTTITYTARFDNQKYIIFDVYAIFFKRSSWVKEASKSYEALKHEQGHFDIAAIFAAKLEDTLNKMKFEKDFSQSQVDEIKNHVLQLEDAFQQMYDATTTSPFRPYEQQLWNDLIMTLLTCSYDRDR